MDVSVNFTNAIRVGQMDVQSPLVSRHGWRGPPTRGDNKDRRQELTK
jgi:hypothetical protein